LFPNQGVLIVGVAYRWLSGQKFPEGGLSMGSYLPIPIPILPGKSPLSPHHGPNMPCRPSLASNTPWRVKIHRKYYPVAVQTSNPGHPPSQLAHGPHMPSCPAQIPLGTGRQVARAGRITTNHVAHTRGTLNGSPMWPLGTPPIRTHVLLTPPSDVYCLLIYRNLPYAILRSGLG